MTLPRVLLLALALLSFSPRSAWAQGFLSPFVGFGFGGDSATCISLTNCEEKRLSWGASIGSTNGVFGLEQDIAYAPDFFGKTSTGDNAMLTLMSNMMIVIPAGPIQPYGVLGIGLMRPHVKFDSLTQLDKNVFGWDFGGGLNIFLTHGFGLRGDVRRMRSFKNVTLGVFGNDHIDFWRGSAGVTLRF
jgi:opacity protein-like surface antigen